MELDLAAYFKRIGYVGPRTPSVAVLAQIAHCHALSIPFENLNAFAGLPVSLDPALVFDKLVCRSRGGWCFEQNLLLGAVLRELGFDVIDLAGRVVWGRAFDAVSARTHRLLCVHCEGRDWLADAGFGGLTLTGVLAMDTEAEQATSHESFRLRRLATAGAMPAEILQEACVRGEWLPLYRFDMQPQQPIDFEAANYQLSTDPNSRFVQGLIVTRNTAAGRDVLRGRELNRYGRDGSQRSELLDASAVMTTLRELFGIHIDALPNLRARIESQSLAMAQATNQIANQTGSAARS